jgi:hypothetical protein
VSASSDVDLLVVALAGLPGGSKDKFVYVYRPLFLPPPQTLTSLSPCSRAVISSPFLVQLDSGPWFSTQLTISLTVGLGSFFVFCALRRVERFKVLYSPRTLIKGLFAFFLCCRSSVDRFSSSRLLPS